MATTTPTTRADDGLFVLGTRVPLTRYLADVWGRRHFARALADSDLRAAHMNSVLGQAWHLINPAMMVAVYFIVFGVILDARRGIDDYLTFLVTGVIVFRFCQSAITGCGRCIDLNIGLVRTIQFPRALVPIAEVLAHFISLLSALAVVLVVSVVDGVVPTWRLAFLPVVIALTIAVALGLGLGVARAGVTIADLNQVLPHLFRLLLYVSGVLFSVQREIRHQWVRDLFTLNPFYCIVSAARWCVLGTPTDRLVPYGLVGWAAVCLVAGMAYFRRAEHRYGS